MPRLRWAMGHHPPLIPITTIRETVVVNYQNSISIHIYYRKELMKCPKLSYILIFRIKLRNILRGALYSLIAIILLEFTGFFEELYLLKFKNAEGVKLVKPQPLRNVLSEAIILAYYDETKKLPLFLNQDHPTPSPLTR